MKFGRNVPQVNVHQLTESDFWCDVILSRWRPWRHFTQKLAAAWWMHTESLPSAYAAWSSARQFLSVLLLQLCYYSWCQVWWGGFRRWAGRDLATTTHQPVRLWPTLTHSWLRRTSRLTTDLSSTGYWALVIRWVICLALSHARPISNFTLINLSASTQSQA